MYELSVERTFCAAHSLVIHGRQEPTHGHNWHVTVVVKGKQLDEDGLLCDFHLIERRLDAIIGPMNNSDLNAHTAFARRNPSAELVAQYIAETLMNELPSGVRLKLVSVTEAPGCTATYKPS